MFTWQEYSSETNKELPLPGSVSPLVNRAVLPQHDTVPNLTAGDDALGDSVDSCRSSEAGGPRAIVGEDSNCDQGDYEMGYHLPFRQS